MDPAFILLAGVATAAALMMVTRRNPVYSAVWLLVTFLAVAGVFIKLTATFLAAIHVLVYTGAILVLFVFVIMLLNLREDEFGEEHPIGYRLGAAALGAATFLGIAIPALQDPQLASAVPAAPAEFGSVASVGRLLFIDYALPFELVSLLIVAAMFGGLLIAKKQGSPRGET